MRVTVLDTRSYEVPPGRLAVIVAAFTLTIVGPLLAGIGLISDGPWQPSDYAWLFLYWPVACGLAGLLDAWALPGRNALYVALLGPTLLAGSGIALAVAALFMSGGEMPILGFLYTAGLMLLVFWALAVPVAAGYGLGRGLAALRGRGA